MALKFEDIKLKIIEELKKRVPDFRCPVCNKGEMILVEGFINHPLQDELAGGIVLGGKSVPTVAIVCKNCGHTMEFSVGALGLLPKQEEIKKEKESNNSDHDKKDKQTKN